MRVMWCGWLLVMGVALAGARAQSARSRAEVGPEGTGPASAGAGGGVTVPAGRNAGGLRLMFPDMAGGQAMLVVTPAGRSLLIDAGSAESGGRDAARIVAMARRAGLKRLDVVLLTQFGADHAGGVGELVRRISVGRFLDAGDAVAADGEAAGVRSAYLRMLRGRKIVRKGVKVGDVLPIKGVRAEVVSAGGAVTMATMTGEGAGTEVAACRSEAPAGSAGSEGDRSVAVMLTFGPVRVLDPGDLTAAKQRLLVCPVNNLGRVDLLVVSDHGRAESSSAALLAATRPRVAVMQNGARRGGDPMTLRMLEAPASGVGALWQMHAAEGVGPELNTVQERMANRAGEEGSSLEVDAEMDGSLEVTNGRTGEIVRYTREK